MLGDISVVDDIYIVCGYTDMRKQIDGLCSIVKNQFIYDLSKCPWYDLGPVKVPGTLRNQFIK